MWTSEAPASNASCVDSICSAVVIGTAGLSRLRGTEPVIATAMTTGLMVRSCAVANRWLSAREATRKPECPAPGSAPPRGFGRREHSRRLLLVEQDIPHGRRRPANVARGSRVRCFLLTRLPGENHEHRRRILAALGPLGCRRSPAPHHRHRRRLFGQPGRVVRFLRLFLHRAVFRAVMPTYASIGAAAPALLLVARLVQGLS